MKNFFQWALVIGFVAVLVFLLVEKKDALKESPESGNITVGQLKIAGVALDVEVASTRESQTQGLSGKSALLENQGMLFVFEKPARYSFWMKDMNFPIDIIWIAENHKVVYIKKNARPESYPESFTPDENAQYVLEVVAGFSEKNNLKEGDIVEFTF